MKRWKTKALIVFISGIMIVVTSAYLYIGPDSIYNHLARLPKIKWNADRISEIKNNSVGLEKTFSWMRDTKDIFKTVNVHTNKNHITSIVNDGRYVWVGSTGGLRRMDDMADVVDKEFVSELPTPDVRDMALGKNHLYLVTSGGIARIKREDEHAKVQSISLPDGVPASSLTSITRHGDDWMLIGTDRYGLVLVSDEKTLSLPWSQPLKSTRVTSLASLDGEVFAGTPGKGIYKFRFSDKGGVDEWITKDEGLPDNWITDLMVWEDRLYASTTNGIAVYKAGKINVLTDQGGFVTALGTCPDGKSKALCAAFDNADIALVEGPNRGRKLLENQLIITALEVNGAKLWAGSEEGLNVIGASGQRKIISSGPVSNDVNTLTVWNNHLWVGTFDQGLSSFDGQKWNTLTVKDGLASNMINHIKPVNGRLWIATMQGVSVYDGESFQTITEDDGLGSNHVLAVAVWNNRTVFATAAGITIKEGKSYTSYGPDHGLLSKNVYTLAAKENDLYAGTLNGISKFDGKNWTDYSFQNGDLPDNWINALCIHKGDIWAGTYDMGLAQISSDASKFFKEGKDIPYGWVNPNAMLSDGSTMWVGLTHGGMLVKRADGFKYLTVSDGLPGNDVTSFARYKGHIFVGTRSGLVEIAEKEGGLDVGFKTGRTPDNM
jgi:ligand-binding sensor domain-containing protein